nr:hypothetical protein [Tanacetum cinerariifolium]
MEDKVLWLKRYGNPVSYSTKAVWKDLRGFWPIVKWHHVIWFFQFNPKHAFMMWMAIQGRLMTQDRIKIWKKDDDLKCPLCKKVADSHKHLFYECEYSIKVWKEMRQFMKLDSDYESMVEVIELLEDKASKNKICRVLNRLMLAVVTYFIWQERNGRIFKPESRTKIELYCVIKENIKNKLMSLRIKRSSVLGSLVIELLWSYMLLDGATSCSPPSHCGCGLNVEGEWKVYKTESWYNYTMLATLLSALGFDPRQCITKVQGDDSIIRLNTLIPEELHESFMLRLVELAVYYFNATVNIKKSEIGNTLNGRQVLSYRNHHGIPSRDAIIMLAQFYHTKARDPTPDITMAQAVGFAYASCGNHERVLKVLQEIYCYYQAQGITPNRAGLTHTFGESPDNLLVPEISLDHFP